MLAEQCWSCHGAAMQQGGLRLDSREAVLIGGGRGPAIVPGDPDASVLIQALRHQEVQMPLGGKLPDDKIADFAKWIEVGAPWPASQPGSVDEARAAQRARAHWAFRPVRPDAPPSVRDEAWVLNEVDAFIFAKLEEAGLRPAPQADRRTLMRRLSFDLTGLPPRPEEVEAFAHPGSSEAYENVVDRLLDSERFGEHWARFWMDWVRYCESHGSQGDFRLPMAWRYRDYLIRAFNADVPYDRMLLEYLAGDLLEDPRINEKEKLNESILGTGNLRMVEYGYVPVDALDDQVKVVDNQIDVLSKAFQGLSVSCARCHDHKFDPITQEDFYALYGVFASSRHGLVTVDSAETLSRGRDQLEDLRGQVRAALIETWEKQVDTMAAFLRQADLALTAGEDSGPDDDSEGDESARLAGLIDRLQGDALPENHPLQLWLALRGLDGDAFHRRWDAFRQEWLEKAREWGEFNRSEFRTVWDMRKTNDYEQWFPHGPGIPERPLKNGEIRILPEGDQVVAGLYPAGVYTGLDSQKYGGILGSPRFTAPSDSISLRVVGGNYASARLVVENYPIGDGGIHPAANLSSDQPKWIRLDTVYRKGQNAYIEFETLDDRSREHRPSPRDSPAARLDGRSNFGVLEVVVHDGDEPPKEEPLALLHLLDGEPPAGLEDLETQFGVLTQQALQAWAEDTLDDRQTAFLDAVIRTRLLPTTLSELPELGDVVGHYRKAEHGAPIPRRAPGVLPGTSFDQPLFVRGDHTDAGDPVERRFLEFLGGRPFSVDDSGRLQLARELANEDNPLTARVLVNRLWHHLFGRGLVSTVDNFGVTGSRPSHPALLDFLAQRFVASGWSIKSMIRLLVLSRTYRMSSDASHEARSSDAENRLLQHQNFRRLPAESIRDAILEVSGELDKTLYGPSINVYYVGKTEGGGERGPLDGERRRSVYQSVRRNAQNPLLEVFDAPKPSTTRGRRDVTNIPAQSLAMLNDPYVVDQATKWANRTLADGSISPQDRALRMFRRALGRNAEPAEVDLLMTALTAIANEYQVSDWEAMGSQDLWKDFAQTLFNLKEFLYVR